VKQPWLAEYEQRRNENVKKRIVLIGAGSAQFGFGTLGDIFKSEVLAGSHVVLHDINAEAMKQVQDVAQAYVDENDLPFTLSATTSRPEALQGADFCISSIEVGDRFALWEMDWQVPLQYGIRQVYGENGGPGGLFHSLRIIPPILEICGDIVDICPEAYVFNFSNPMSRICTTVQRKYPDLRLIGLCHEIGSIPRHLPRLLGVPFEKLQTKSGGLNHFSVLLECTYKDTGKDAYPEIREKAPAYFAKLPTLRQMVQLWQEFQARQAEQKEQGEQTVRDRAAIERAIEALEPDYLWHERGLFKVILERFGYLPITTDSHFGEYIQWAHDIVDHRGILDFYHFYKQWTSSKEPEMGQEATGERVVPIIEGILTDSGQEEMAVNLPNAGYIDNLPEWIVVEVPATVDKDGVHGIPLGQLPSAFAGLLYNQVAIHDMTAEAVLSGSKDVVLQALLVDPVVTSYRAAEQTLDTILELQKPYLDYIR
jgi:alpha-galactosidase